MMLVFIIFQHVLFIVSFLLAAFCWQNHYHVMLLLSQGCRIFQSLQIFRVLVCNWLHSVGQNHFHVMMLLNRDSVIFKVFIFRVILLEDSAQIPSQRNWIPCIRPGDVIFRLDAQLSKHHSSRRRELSVQTFLCVENLWIVPGCI